ncbi:MAG: hypothetical protein L0Z62_32695 [Gemmataceae bacterium]|nr:hypothetical protein [Gemmataceae bacterium]
MNPPGESPSYQVHCSGQLAQTIKDLQRQASRAGAGEQFLAAIKTIHERLSNDPLEFGEPIYHLQALKLSVRVGIVSPPSWSSTPCIRKARWSSSRR